MKNILFTITLFRSMDKINLPFVLTFFASNFVKNARHSFGYACAFCLISPKKFKPQIGQFILSTFLTCFVLQISAQKLYDTDVITTIEITFQDSNWDQILNDSFSLGQGGRLMAEIEINGTAFDSVGVRYRSSSTYSAVHPKKSLNIKLDYLKNQDFQGFEVLKLANGAKDPSFLREVFGYELARQYMKAPQANYARVFINGTYHGLFANTESVNKKFLGGNYLSDSDNPRFEGNPDYDFDPPTPPFGCEDGLGSSMEYLGTGIACYIPHYDIQSDAGWDELANATMTLKDSPQNARQVIDLDRFMWMSVFNNLITSYDSYLGAVPRNWHIFQQDNGRFTPTIDDLNESFGRYPWIDVPMVGSTQPTIDEFINLDPFYGESDDRKPVLKTILGDPTWKRMYAAHYRTVLSQNFTNGIYKTRTQELRDLIGNALSQDPNKIYSEADFNANYTGSITDSFDGTEIAFGITELMDNRTNFLQGISELTDTPPTISNISNSPNFPTPGEQVAITAAINANIKVLLGYRTDIKDIFELVEMFDDGNHSDGSAGDGVYGAEVTVGIGGLQYYIYAENNDAGRFDPQLAELEYHTLGVAGDIVINEVLADNETIQADQDGEFDDWVELYNNSNQTIDISGWYLTDNPTDLAKWTFPTGVTIDPGEYLIVWVDDDEEQMGLHTSFNLSNNGEELLLVDPQLNIIDQAVFGAQTDDIAFARCPNGLGAFEQITPTFASSNNEVCMVGTNDLVRGIDYKIYPNPAGNWLKVETAFQTPIQVDVWNSIGHLMIKETMIQETILDTSILPEGLYFLRIGDGAVEKVLISK